MFKTGDKVICIDNLIHAFAAANENNSGNSAFGRIYNFFAVPSSPSSRLMSDRLTINKIYVVIRCWDGYSISERIIEILDDNGNKCTFVDSRFISLKEYRKRKLEKLKLCSK